MPSTYTPIATTTLGSAAANITFTSISGSYTDLILVVNGAGSSGSTSNILVQFNGDTAGNYSYTRLLGDGSAASSARASTQGAIATGDTNTDRFVNIVNFQNYSNSTTNKTVISRSNSQSYLSAYVGLWRSTAAITSIVYYISGQNLATGTTATLYGVKSA
jgi:hypothetical protein